MLMAWRSNRSASSYCFWLILMTARLLISPRVTVLVGRVGVGDGGLVVGGCPDAAASAGARAVVGEVTEGLELVDVLGIDRDDVAAALAVGRRIDEGHPVDRLEVGGCWAAGQHAGGPGRVRRNPEESGKGGCDLVNGRAFLAPAASGDSFARDDEDRVDRVPQGGGGAGGSRTGRGAGHPAT